MFTKSTILQGFCLQSKIYLIEICIIKHNRKLINYNTL